MGLKAWWEAIKEALYNKEIKAAEELIELLKNKNWCGWREKQDRAFLGVEVVKIEKYFDLINMQRKGTQEEKNKILEEK